MNQRAISRTVIGVVPHNIKALGHGGRIIKPILVGQCLELPTLLMVSNGTIIGSYNRRCAAKC